MERLTAYFAIAQIMMILIVVAIILLWKMG